jgi:serine protease Do
MLARSLAIVSALGLALVASATRADDPFLRRTTTVQVVERAGPAVVNITTERLVQPGNPFHPFAGDPFFDQFFRDFFVPQGPRRAQSVGSGVLIDRDGHVLTNEHVVRRTSRILLSLSDGREFEADLVGADPNNDIAVLRVRTDEELPWIPPGDASDLMVGEPVIAIGNPFGLSSTVTTGVISALDRSIRTGDRDFHGFIQTDASINPGNSGGPLLNAEGSLIGINTAIYQNAQGIGFAIPIDVARRIVSDLIDDGRLTPVWLGLGFQELTPDLARALALPEHRGGALVNRVREGSPADRAGVHPGDVVTHVDGRAVPSARNFFALLDSATAGQELELTLWRDGAARKRKVRLEAIPEDAVERLTQELLGMRLVARDGPGYRVDAVRPNSGAERIGIQRGDVLLGISGRALEDDDVLRRCVLELRGKSQALIVVQRGSGRYHVSIPLV